MPKIAYRFAFDDLRRLILSGQMGQPGEILPAENTLAIRYNVCRPTIRKVLQMLAEENLLESKPGIGWRLLAYDGKEGGSSSIRRNRHIRIGIDTESDLWGYFYYDLILDGLKCGAEECGCELILLKEESMEKTDGIILSRITPELFEKYEPVVESGTPVVILNRIPVNPRFSCFSIDHMEEARRATEVLLLFGHRKIAVLADNNSQAVRERLNGWYLAFAANGLTPPEHLILSDSSITVQEEFLKREHPSAFFVLAGASLGRFLLSAERCHLKIPEDISLLCFDDMSRQPFLDIPVSHVRMPLEEMGKRAVHAITERLCSPRKALLPPKRELLEAELVITSSCRNIRSVRINRKHSTGKLQGKGSV